MYRAADRRQIDGNDLWSFGASQQFPRIINVTGIHRTRRRQASATISADCTATTFVLRPKAATTAAAVPAAAGTE
jgi:hypothetical protein